MHFCLFLLTLQAPCFDHFICVLYIQLQMSCFFESSRVKLDFSQPSVCLTRADPYHEVQKLTSSFFQAAESRVEENEETSIAM